MQLTAADAVTAIGLTLDAVGVVFCFGMHQRKIIILKQRRFLKSTKQRVCAG